MIWVVIVATGIERDWQLRRPLFGKVQCGVFRHSVLARPLFASVVYEAITGTWDRGSSAQNRFDAPPTVTCRVPESDPPRGNEYCGTYTSKMSRAGLPASLITRLRLPVCTSDGRSAQDRATGKFQRDMLSMIQAAGLRVNPVWVRLLDAHDGEGL